MGILPQGGHTINDEELSVWVAAASVEPAAAAQAGWLWEWLRGAWVQIVVLHARVAWCLMLAYKIENARSVRTVVP